MNRKLRDTLTSNMLSKIMQIVNVLPDLHISTKLSFLRSASCMLGINLKHNSMHASMEQTRTRETRSKSAEHHFHVNRSHNINVMAVQKYVTPIWAPNDLQF